MKSNRGRKACARGPEGGLSRREFARGATVAAAAMAALPSGVLAEAALAAHHGARLPLPQEAQGEKPKLSAEAQAEVEAKVADILRRYGERLNDEQKADIRRLVREAQAPLESLRAYALENSDEPATILHLVGVEEGARRRREPRAAAGHSKRRGA
jgi:hypothetical protein